MGDFNQDGKLDLVTGLLLSPGAAEFLGNGDGTFQTVKTYLSGSGGPMVADDFNGDNKPDLVLLDGLHDKVASMLNTGALSFSPSSPLNFPVQVVGTSSSSLSVTLTNTGSGFLRSQHLRIAARGRLMAHDAIGAHARDVWYF